MKKYIKSLIIFLSSVCLIACASKTQAAPGANHHTLTQNSVQAALDNGVAGDKAASNEAAVSSDSAENGGSHLNLAPPSVADSNDASGKDDIDDKTEDGVDVDLTKMSANMVFAEVFGMMSDPKSYIGKKIKINGEMAIYADPSAGKAYYACIIKDALACCTSGMEFELTEGEYPQSGENFTVIGTFTTYNEGDLTYCRLADAVIVK